MDKVVKLLPNYVHILPVTLRMRLLSRLCSLKEAILVMNDVLNNDSANHDISSRIAKIAVDELESILFSQEIYFDLVRFFRKY